MEFGLSDSMVLCFIFSKCFHNRATGVVIIEIIKRIFPPSNKCQNKTSFLFHVFGNTRKQKRFPNRAQPTPNWAARQPGCIYSPPFRQTVPSLVSCRLVKRCRSPETRIDSEFEVETLIPVVSRSDRVRYSSPLDPLLFSVKKVTI